MNKQEQRVRAAAYKLGVPKDILENIFLRPDSSVMFDEQMGAEEIADAMVRVCQRGGMALSAPTNIVEHIEQDVGDEFDEALDVPRSPGELPDEVCEALDLPSRHNAGEAFLHQITERC